MWFVTQECAFVGGNTELPHLYAQVLLRHTLPYLCGQSSVPASGSADLALHCAQVLGLTVLAWGNSIGDMSTNLAMARKGLANMAMTACYAGPVFNLLVRRLRRPLAAAICCAESP